MKKKIIIGVVIFLAIIGLGLGTYFIFFNKDKDTKPATNNKDEKITITFDSDGGTKVEDMKVKKGSSFQLPETTKEGYTFVGWYNGSKLYTDDDTASIKKDIVLTAKWEENKKEITELKVTFDSKGGSKVKDVTFKCTDEVATIKNLSKPTKDGYNFMSWEDKHGKSILDGASIVCDGTDLKLYAVWEKKEETKPTTVTEPVKPITTEPEKKKEYKCPDGYELKDTNKCVSIKSAEYYCETGKESNGTGSKVCYSWAGNPTSTTCKTLNGYKGTYIPNAHGDAKCGYQELDSYIGQQQNCQNHGGTLASNNHCYKQIELATESILNHTCAGTSAYRTSAELGNTANSGCYNLSQRTYGCKTVGEGYSYNYTTGKCVKTIDATLE